MIFTVAIAFVIAAVFVITAAFVIAAALIIAIAFVIAAALIITGAFVITAAFIIAVAFGSSSYVGQLFVSADFNEIETASVVAGIFVITPLRPGGERKREGCTPLKSGSGRK